MSPLCIDTEVKWESNQRVPETVGQNNFSFRDMNLVDAVYLCGYWNPSHWTTAPKTEKDKRPELYFDGGEREGSITVKKLYWPYIYQFPNFVTDSLAEVVNELQGLYKELEYAFTQLTKVDNLTIRKQDFDADIYFTQKDSDKPFIDIVDGEVQL